LFKAWPLLHGWLNDEREFLAGKAQLARALADWNNVSLGEKRIALLQGIQLRRAEQWLRTHPQGLSTEEVDFIRASRREVRRRRDPIAVLAAAVVLMIGGIVGQYAYAAYVRRTALDCDLMAAERDNDVGVPGVEYDRIVTVRAIPACDSAVNADPENPRLMHELARSLDRGGKFKEAAYWYGKAADIGWAWSKNNLGVLYLQGRPGVPVDFERGVGLLRSAAEQNNEQAITNYAREDFATIFEGSPVRVAIVEKALVNLGFLLASNVTGNWGPALATAIDEFKVSAKLPEKGVTLRVLDRLGVIAEISTTTATRQ
jgi:TPR repeat protein